MKHDRLSLKLWQDLMKSKYRGQAEKIMNKVSGDIDPTFLAFVDVYRGLSLAIDEDWTIYDFGCAYNYQNWYFRKHKKYIAINPNQDEVMMFDNTEFVKASIQEYLPRVIPPKSFAICSAVPAPQYYDLIKKSFNNLFIWYPE